jgi:hypothetical protein
MPAPENLPPRKAAAKYTYLPKGISNLSVIPAKAGIYIQDFLDPGIRRDDDNTVNLGIPSN